MYHERYDPLLHPEDGRASRVTPAQILMVSALVSAALCACFVLGLIA